MKGQKDRKSKRIKDAMDLDRPGYWACIKCFVHNPKVNKICFNCDYPKDYIKPVKK